jgi:carboxymethylenebutenolidase
MGTMVTFGGSTSSGTGYLSEPVTPGPGVLVVHDFYGALPHVHDLCDALAVAGFTALGPDLYGGRVAADPAEAEHLLATLDVRRAREMRAHPSVRPERIGAVGFAMGGWLALLAAVRGVFNAVVSYYGVLGPDERAFLGCPVLLQLAETDRYDPPDAVEGFVAELRAGGGQVEQREWPGTRHGFANADVRSYVPAQAAAAWESTTAFLGRELRSAS